MHPICYEMIIAAQDSEKDFFCECLTSLGETTYVEGAIDCDIEFDYDELASTDYYEKNANNSPIILYSEDKNHLESVKNQLHNMYVANFSREISIIIQPIADQNWRESWRASFKPIYVGDTFCILPPWENESNHSQLYKIVIDPGMAFGTGQHETTQLCLKFLLNESNYTRVFDVGTGSGILAIAAHKKHPCFILGCDVDAESVNISIENANKNGTGDIVFTATNLAQITESNFDLVFANIQNKPLRNIMPDIIKKMAPKARLIISGILTSECDEFCDFLKSHKLNILGVETMGNWVGILCCHG